MEWFTADLHLGHKRIVELCYRPFATVEEMDDALIYNINSVVGVKDTLYHLGDFALGSKHIIEGYKQLKCKNVVFLKGNHDKDALKKVGLLGLPNFCVLENQILERNFFIDNQKQKIIMSHYPMRAWNKSVHGVWHLFGHEHGMLPPHGLSFDVGVDTNNYMPYSLEDIARKMATMSREFVIDP